jgi:hypothetical protein
LFEIIIKNLAAQDLPKDDYFQLIAIFMARKKITGKRWINQLMRERLDGISEHTASLLLSRGSPSLIEKDNFARILQIRRDKLDPNLAVENPLKAQRMENIIEKYHLFYRHVEGKKELKKGSKVGLK